MSQDWGIHGQVSTFLPLYAQVFMMLTRGFPALKMLPLPTSSRDDVGDFAHVCPEGWVGCTPSHPYHPSFTEMFGITGISWMCLPIAWAVKKHRQRRARTQRRCQNDSNASVSSTPSLHEDAQRELVGLGIFAAAVGLPGWHVLPMFLNMKMAADPALPGLTEETLPIATTAIFVGWLAGATVLDRALEIFDKKQLVVLHVLGLLLVNFAILTLPHLTAGNLVVFTMLRFAHGLLMNLTGLVRMYLMEKMPPSQGNQVLVLLSIIYTMATILMSWSCGRITMMIDWRLEGFLWCSVPLMIGLVVAFPNWRSLMQSFPVGIEKVSNVVSHNSDVAVETVSTSNRIDILALAMGFLACDCGFYGLTYSAGKLCQDPYLSTMLLCGADIFGYLLALGADKYGRNNTQTCAFLLAGICLFYCSTGEEGSFFVLTAAVVGRLCLDVCFTTVYLGLAEIFSGSKVALATCETAARFGAIIAPFSGTLPPSISCSIFATVCLAAAGCTMTLPEKAAKNSATVIALTSISWSKVSFGLVGL